MTTYRLLYARIATIGGTVPVDHNDNPLYFRRRGRDKRHGWLTWHLVNGENARFRPTEWRTLDGITQFLDANPTLAEQFDIAEVSA